MINHLTIMNAKILIVDDQNANVILLEQLLKDAGYRDVDSTTDPFSVRKLHFENQYDLILLDMHMPGMSGFDVMEELKKFETNGYIPVLVVTTQAEHKLAALNAGAKDFLSKPFDVMEARVRIYNMLEVRLLYKELHLYSRSMESWAMHDALTGLPNRRLLMDRLELAMAHANRNKCIAAVVYLDLDDFKTVNDTHGHVAGDMLLKLVAERLKTAVRQEDTVARFGGDEFVIVLWELKDIDDLDALVSKVLLTLSQPYTIDGESIKIAASAGVSIYPKHSEDIETLITKADIALYESKEFGKNGYRIVAVSD